MSNNTSVQYKKPETLKVNLNPPEIELDFVPPAIDISINTPIVTVIPGTQIIRDTGDIPIYHGDYEVTPSQEDQILDTHGKVLISNIKVNSIPNRYGLITWDGFRLTVS